MTETLYNIFIPNNTITTPNIDNIDNISNGVNDNINDDVNDDVNNNLNKIISEGLDCLIMNHFKEGILYFSEILKKYNNLTKVIENNENNENKFKIKYQAKIFIDNYLITYLTKVITKNEIQYLINNNTDTILEFHNQLVNAQATLNESIMEIWLPILYNGLKDIFRKQFHQIKYSIIITTLSNCYTFRNYLYTKEVDDKLTALNIQNDTLFGILLNYMNSNDKLPILQKMLYRFIYQYDDNGSSFFNKWLFLLHKKNRYRPYIQYQSTVVSSDAFMLNTLRFLLYIWDDMSKNNICLEDIETTNNNERSYLIQLVNQQIELTILPILSKYNYYINKLEEFNDMGYEFPFYNYLTRFKTSLEQKISHFKDLIKKNSDISFYNPIRFYSWIISYIIKYNKSSTITDATSIIIANIFDLIITSYTSHYELLEKDDTLCTPILNLALAVFTEKIKTTNPHIRLLAFKCFYQLEYYITDYKIEDELQVVESIIDIYIKSNTLMNLEYSVNPKNFLINFMEVHADLYKYVDDIETTVIEKFINIIISDLNIYFETYKDKVLFINENTSSIMPDSMQDAVKNIYKKIIDHFKIIRKLVSNLAEPIQVRIFSSLCRCLIFNSRHIILLNNNELHDNYNSICISNLAREISKTYLHFITNSLFKIELLDDNQDFNMEHTKIIFSLSKIESLKCIQDFIEKLETLQKGAEIDYPLEFLDPLLCTLIKNPVILPSTDTIMERTIIERQLLEKQENPFDRSELTLECLNAYNFTESAQMKINDYLSKFYEWLSKNT